MNTTHQINVTEAARALVAPRTYKQAFADMESKHGPVVLQGEATTPEGVVCGLDIFGRCEGTYDGGKFQGYEYTIAGLMTYDNGQFFELDEKKLTEMFPDDVKLALRRLKP